METLQKILTSGTPWALLLPLLVVYCLATLNSTEAPWRPLILEQDARNNTSFSMQKTWHAKHGTNHIYLADLERAIDHILRTQLLKEKVFNGTKLIVLKNIMALLYYLNPLTTDEGKLYINNIYWSIKCRQQVDQSYFEATVNNSELVDQSFRGDRYFGCRSSEPQLRGFNCSLWILFHYWTVAASQPPFHFQPGAVLWVLHGYLHLFMGCQECYENFWFYTQQRQIASVKTHDEEILWLWRAHNYFNRDLAGAITEDPFVPKKQFPQPKYCRKCRNYKGDWKTHEVLKYLKSIYSPAKLNMFGLKPHVGIRH